MSAYGRARDHRRAIARRCATTCFAAAIVCAIVATWAWHPQWAITAGVLLFAALVAGLVAIP